MSDLVLARGDQTALALTLKDSAGAALNLTGKTVRFTARDPTTDAIVIAKSSAVAGEIAITDAANGLAEVNLLSADTSALPATTALVYDVEVTTVAPARTETVNLGTAEAPQFVGRLVVVADVTRGV